METEVKDCTFNHFLTTLEKAFFLKPPQTMPGDEIPAPIEPIEPIPGGEPRPEQPVYVPEHPDEILPIKDEPTSYNHLEEDLKQFFAVWQ